MHRLSRSIVLLFGLTAALASTSSIASAEKQEGLIVTCARPCAAVVNAVTAAGGAVSHRYDNVDAVAVTVPASRVADLTATLGSASVRKDVIVNLPPPSRVVEAGAIAGAEIVDAAAVSDLTAALPANYNYNNGLTGAASLHAEGLLGLDVVVAVIDSGTAVAATELNGTVIGGENFVTSEAISATSRLNDWHGTSVGAMIAAHANFIFANTSTLVRSLNAYAPSSVVPCPATCPSPATQSLVPMIGTAPGARIYAMKVFPAAGGGAPSSRIIAAMDRAITLRRNFNNGVAATPIIPPGGATENNPATYNALNIRVVNMSLGGPTLIAGKDIEDQLTVEMTKVGITIVVAAGNDGFTAMTGGSPGTGIGALTVGASSTPVHERVLRDLQFGFGIGPLYRPFNGVQTVDFSSRGPTADGRLDPDMSANGLGSYTAVFAATNAGNAIVSCGSPAAVAGTCVLRILFVSGTSFASPTTAGAAALLRGAVPAASALPARTAIILGANPTTIADGSGRIDQGAGFLDVPEALTLLRSGTVKDELPRKERADDRDDEPDDVGAGGKSVQANLAKIGIGAVRFKNNRFSASTGNLLPGQVVHYFIPSDLFTESLKITITNIVREGAVNTLFGDDLFVQAADAPTSTVVHRIHDSAGNDGAFVAVDTAFVIDHPQTGLVRLGLQGDWTNASRISANVTIERVRRLPTLPSAVAFIRQDDVIPYTVTVPAGATQAVFETFWLQNWGRYPTNDLDVTVLTPSGTEFEDGDGNPPGATLNSPERVVVADPAAGTWTLLVSGFAIHGKLDLFTVTATADGKRLKIEK